MSVFLFFLGVCFLWGTFFWDRKPTWHAYLLTGLAALLCIAYLVFNQL